MSVILAVLAAPRATLSQAVSPDPADDLFPSVAEQIERIQSSQGVNSPELIDPLTNFGLLLRGQGDADLAVAAFERARHIVRVNYGLSSFKEAPLVRQLVQIEEEKGKAAAAWELEQELLDMIRRNPGPAAAPMLREIADKRVDVLERYAAGEYPPQIELGCYYAGPPRRDPAAIETEPRSCRSGTSSSVKQALYQETRGYYLDTIEMIQLSEGRSAEEIPELYRAWVRAMYAARNDFNTEYEGRGTLSIIHSRLVSYSRSLAAQMSSLVDIADWDLLFAGGRKENQAAFQAYEALYEQAERGGLARSSIDALFSPSLPVVLPAFLPNPLISIETSSSTGFVDVAFDITKYGEAKSIEVLASSTNTTDTASKRIKQLIERSRFRPRVANGLFEDPSRVVVRYYVND